MSSIIKVTGIKLYAYHGCLPEEAVIGANYIVDVVITADLGKPLKTDDIADTVDYSKIYDIVKAQMEIRSNLIEHVAKRIVDELINLQKVEKAEVAVTKIKPPISGHVDTVSATVTSEK